jgi:SAM-dependent methyltransferase
MGEFIMIITRFQAVRIVACLSFIIHLHAGTISLEERSVLNLISYAKYEKPYGGSEFEAGYQSIFLGNKYVEGQRDCKWRLESVPYDFTDKVVLDIGTNQGGMLFAIAHKIKYGIGIDYNPKLINVANRIKSCGQISNLDFYVFDLDKEALSIIENFLKSKTVDICFFLSMCQWIKQWQNVVNFIYEHSNALLFESNGSKKMQEQERDFLAKKYTKVQLIKQQSDDDKKGYKRKLYICFK